MSAKNLVSSTPLGRCNSSPQVDAIGRGFVPSRTLKNSISICLWNPVGGIPSAPVQNRRIWCSSILMLSVVPSSNSMSWEQSPAIHEIEYKSCNRSTSHIVTLLTPNTDMLVFKIYSSVLKPHNHYFFSNKNATVRSDSLPYFLGISLLIVDKDWNNIVGVETFQCGICGSQWWQNQLGDNWTSLIVRGHKNLNNQRN